MRRSKVVVAATVVTLAALGCKTPGGSRALEDSAAAYKEVLATAADYAALAETSGQETFVKFSHFYAVPAGDELANRIAFQNTRTYAFHADFLKATFARYANVQNYSALILHPKEEDVPSAKEISAGAIYYKQNVQIPGWDQSEILGFSIYFNESIASNGINTSIDVAEVARFQARLKETATFIAPENIAYIIPHKADYFKFKSKLTAAGVKVVKGWDFHKATRQPTAYSAPQTSFGFLRRLSEADLRDGTYGDRDILVLDTVPLDIGPTSGIITAQPQVPHSHVIFRAVNQKIPDAYIPDAAQVPAIADNLNKLVRFELKVDGTYSIAPASPEDAQAYWDARVPNLPDLQANLTVTTLFDFAEGEPTADMAIAYGAKGTNFALLDRALRGAGHDRTAFKGAFLVPISFYKKHTESKITAEVCTKAGEKCADDVGSSCQAEQQACVAAEGQTVGSYIASAMRPEKRAEMNASPTRRRQVLTFIGRLIRHTKLASEITGPIKTKMTAAFSLSRRIRLRSSTNAEDLAGLNGAGLYKSHSACLGDKDTDDGQPSKCQTSVENQRIKARISQLKSLPADQQNDMVKALIADLEDELTDKNELKDAIRKVYASLWTEKAYLNREYYRLDHLKVYMGILVHPSFIDEAANGVALTEIGADGAMTANIVSQYEDVSITNPELPGAVPEQVLITRQADGSFGAPQYLSTSNLPPQGARVFSEAELKQLVEQLHGVAMGLKSAYPGGQFDGKIDYEFKLDGQRDVLIKQARPLN